MSPKQTVLPALVNEAYPKAALLPWVTPVEHQPRLSRELGVDLWVKRDDLTGLAFGGNKVRKLEFYFGQALRAGADTVLITGAVQSNYTRVVAACAARLGMQCHIQLEERVPDVDSIHRRSGNVLLDQILGATIHSYPVGDDEAGADQRLREIAVDLRAQGRVPYVIPLGADNPPLGALGYVECAGELLNQLDGIDVVSLPSGSGQTHAGLLFGLRRLGWRGRVVGICVRRDARAQSARIAGHCLKLAGLLGESSPVKDVDIELHDDTLAPGYGIMNEQVAQAIALCARLDGLLVEPVYTGRAMAGLMARVRGGSISEGARVVFIHTGGLPALFAYETHLRSMVIDAS